MLFINKKEENVKIRLGSLSCYDWYTIRPGEIMDLPEHVGFSAGLIEAKNSVENNINNINNINISDKPEISEVQNEEPNKEDKQDNRQLISEKEFKKELVSIKGIGEKYASEIINLFKNQEELIKAVKSGIEIHKNDRIDKLVKLKYNG